jgi:hypothetical protein
VARSAEVVVLAKSLEQPHRLREFGSCTPFSVGAPATTFFNSIGIEIIF